MSGKVYPRLHPPPPPHTPIPLQLLQISFFCVHPSHLISSLFSVFGMCFQMQTLCVVLKGAVKFQEVTVAKLPLGCHRQAFLCDLRLCCSECQCSPGLEVRSKKSSMRKSTSRRFNGRHIVRCQPLCLMFSLLVSVTPRSFALAAGPFVRNRQITACSCVCHHFGGDECFLCFSRRNMRCPTSCVFPGSSPVPCCNS